MEKAQGARAENDKGAMKDSASLLATNFIQEYYDKVYVQSDSTFRTTYANAGAYAKAQFPSATAGGYTYAVSGDTLTVTDTKGNSVTGTILDSGNISWIDGTSSSENQTPVTLPENAVQSLAQNGDIDKWDKVNYNPGDLTTASINLPEGASIEGTKLAALSLPSGASLSRIVTANNLTDWVVLDVNETTGEVLIVPDTSSESNSGKYAELTLSGMDGYNNAITIEEEIGALDAVAGIYANPTYANSARSITVDDVAKADDTTMAAVAVVFKGNSDFENNEYDSVTANNITKSWNHRYGMDNSLNIVDYGEGHEDEERTYSCTPEQYFLYGNSGELGTNVATYLANGNFWLASRCVDLYTNYCYFYMRTLENSCVYSGSLFYVDSSGYIQTGSNTLSVLPVVSLKYNVLMEKTNGVWQLSVE